MVKEEEKKRDRDRHRVIQSNRQIVKERKKGEHQGSTERGRVIQVFTQWLTQ
jgi:hypothetical protein